MENGEVEIVQRTGMHKRSEDATLNGALESEQRILRQRLRYGETLFAWMMPEYHPSEVLLPIKTTMAFREHCSADIKAGEPMLRPQQSKTEIIVLLL